MIGTVTYLSGVYSGTGGVPQRSVGVVEQTQTRNTNTRVHHVTQTPV